MLERYSLNSETTAWSEADGQYVVLDLAGSTYLRTNGPARALWQRLIAGATEDELVSALTAVYEVPADTARIDVVEFLSDLRQRNLLTVSGS